MRRFESFSRECGNRKKTVSTVKENVGIVLHGFKKNFHRVGCTTCRETLSLLHPRYVCRPSFVVIGCPQFAHCD